MDVRARSIGCAIREKEAFEYIYYIRWREILFTSVGQSLVRSISELCTFWLT